MSAKMNAVGVLNITESEIYGKGEMMGENTVGIWREQGKEGRKTRGREEREDDAANERGER